MTETPASESPVPEDPSAPPGPPPPVSPPPVSPPPVSPPPVPKLLVPKRGAIPTPRWEIEAAEPYVPELGHEPEPDDQAAENVKPPPPEDPTAPQ